MNPLITAAQLKAHGNKNIVIFDCRFNLMDKTLGAQQYREGHIPGAYYLHLETQLSGPVQEHGGRHPLPQIENFTKTLQAAGVNQQTRVVVYDDSRMAYAARAWWLLHYYGHQDVVILDGGYSAWVNAGGAIDKRSPSPKTGNFKARIHTEGACHYADIVQHSSAITLIDSRDAKRFAGEEEPIDPVAGHIPGALNFFWQEITDEKGFIKDKDFHQARWSELKDKDNIVVYCGSGVTACANLLSLQLAGIKAKLYPGSWSDWCSYLQHQQITETP